MSKASVFSIAIFLYISAFAEKPITVYMSGDYSSVEYHLGVLSEIERLKIPIDSVVGSDWGAFVGALWSAGWSSMHIRELVKSWDSIPHAEELVNSALWKKRWLVKHKEDGSPLLEAITESKPYFGKIFFDLRVQESFWRSDIGSLIPFREIDKSADYPFPDSYSGHIAILSTPIALRDTNGTAAVRYQQKLWLADSSLIILRPHSKPNPDSLFEAGVQAVQSKRSLLAKTILDFQPSTFYEERSVPLPRFLYHPVFDSVSAEYQGHLESFWNPKDTGILAVRNFLESLQKDGFYQDARLALDTGSFLQINAKPIPQLAMQLHGFGGTLFGANVAANASFRFINQFGYNLDLTAFYGQGARGVEPEIRFERFFMNNGTFYTRAKVFEYEPISYFQKSIYDYARLMKEKGRGITFGIEKGRLKVAVEFEHREITSGAGGDSIYVYFEADERLLTDIVYNPIAVNTMFPYAKWLWQSEGYERWFASKGFMAELVGGFKALSVNAFQNAPLYAVSQGKLGYAVPISEYISVSAGSEFGVNFRRAEQGRIVLPDELYGFNGYDPALDNRYRFAMGMGCYQEKWQTPSNASHRYGLVYAGFSLQWQGSGIFLTGGFAKDGESNIWSELKPERFFAEPKIRIKTQIFDFVLGQSIIYLDTHPKDNRTFLSVQSSILH
jgi:NTE family protein